MHPEKSLGDYYNRRYKENGIETEPERPYRDRQQKKEIETEPEKPSIKEKRGIEKEPKKPLSFEEFNKLHPEKSLGDYYNKLYKEEISIKAGGEVEVKTKELNTVIDNLAKKIDRLNINKTPDVNIEINAETENVGEIVRETIGDIFKPLIQTDMQ